MMMTYMEIATYLGMITAILAQSRDEAKKDGTSDINEKMLEATRSAQMVMYQLTMNEISKGLNRED